MHALVSATSLLDEDGAYAGSLTMIRDVTERVAQDERPPRASRSSCGTRSGSSRSGSSPAGSRTTSTTSCSRSAATASSRSERLERGENDAGADIEDMLEAADRATQLTRQLLAFGRRQVLQPEVIDLREVVADMEKLLRQLVGDQVELVTISPEAPVLVDADRTQLEQVITNLAVNARDAMPDGGRLAIEVSAAEQRGRGGRARGRPTTAAGWTPRRPRASSSRSSAPRAPPAPGFGLATVHGIVSQSGGRIVLDSPPGEGSTFSIFLPVSEGVQTAPPPALPTRRAERTRSSSSRTTPASARS